MAANHSGRGGDSDARFFAFALILLAGPFVAWFLLRKPLVFLWSWVSYGELWLLAHLAPIWRQGNAAQSLAVNAPVLHWLMWAHANPGEVSFHQVRSMSHALGMYYRWPIAALLIFLAWRNYRSMDLRKDRVTLNQFVVAMKNLFPWGLPWLWQDAGTLAKSRDPAFAYALRPWEFAGNLARAPKGEPDMVVLTDQEAIRQKYVDQLGDLSRPYKSLPVWLQALSSALVPQARDQNNKETFDRLARLARFYYGVTPKKGQPYQAPDLREVPWEVPDEDIAFIDQSAGEHAFQRTAFLALLKRSRSIGIVPPAYMSWLRAVDRTLWYAVQSLDRPRAFVEGAGVVSHYDAEIDAGHSLEHACVDDAVAGLLFALREEDGTPSRKDGE